MSTYKTTKELSPGETWLSLPTADRIIYLDGLIQGLNQGLRHCSTEIAFALATRLPSDLTPQVKLTIDSLIQQNRTWAKSGVTVFKFSRPLEDYAQMLSLFYERYPKYGRLSPAYLLIYMDDQHGMSPAELFGLHEQSLHGFKL